MKKAPIYSILICVCTIIVLSYHSITTVNAEETRNISAVLRGRELVIADEERLISILEGYFAKYKRSYHINHGGTGRTYYEKRGGLLITLNYPEGKEFFFPSTYGGTRYAINDIYFFDSGTELLLSTGYAVYSLDAETLREVHECLSETKTLSAVYNSREVSIKDEEKLTSLLEHDASTSRSFDETYISEDIIKWHGERGDREYGGPRIKIELAYPQGKIMPISTPQGAKEMLVQKIYFLSRMLVVCTEDSKFVFWASDFQEIYDCVDLEEPLTLSASYCNRKISVNDEEGLIVLIEKLASEMNYDERFVKRFWEQSIVDIDIYGNLKETSVFNTILAKQEESGLQIILRFPEGKKLSVPGYEEEQIVKEIDIYGGELKGLLSIRVGGEKSVFELNRHEMMRIYGYIYEYAV